MHIQVKIPPGIAAAHNFIMDHDPHDIDNYLTGNEEHDLDPNPGQTLDNEFGSLADGAVTRAEKERATTVRDQIAQEMWDDYQRLLEERTRG